MNIQHFEERILKIKGQWEKFINDEEVDVSLLDKSVYDSWKRSKKYDINPYTFEHSHFMHLLTSEAFLEIENIMDKYKDILDDLETIAKDKGFDFQIFDKNLKAVNVERIDYYTTRFSMPQKSQFLRIINGYDISENIIGTTAPSIAKHENRIAQVVYFEHYNCSFHDRVCTSAPIYDNDGNLLAVINISRQDMDSINEGLLVAYSLQRIFELRISKKYIYAMSGNRLLVDELIKNNSDGIILLDNGFDVSLFNSTVTKLLGYHYDSNQKEEIQKFVSTLDFDELLVKKQIKHYWNHNEAPVLISLNQVITDNQTEPCKLLKITQYEGNKTSDEFITTYKFNDIIGVDRNLKVAVELAQKVSDTDLPILIYGETGSGKELFAQSIHSASQRKNGPFVAINCGAMPLELVESELFGYEAGAFTGALKEGKKGKIEVASGGTLFLDEIESMPLIIQVKLLRALSTNTITKVGGTRNIPIDVRIVSATKKNLLEEADIDKFREDLYYRISTFEIFIPPLRDRKDDMKIILNHFLKKYCHKTGKCNLGYENEVLDAVKKYYWRGNIREFKNVVQRAVVLASPDRKISLSDLPKNIVSAYEYRSSKSSINHLLKKDNYDGSLKIAEEIIIEEVLIKTKFNLNEAARKLGISRHTLYKKVDSNERLLDLKGRFKN